MKKKGNVEFAWIFALIVGAVILFLAFYFIGTKIISQTYIKTTTEAYSFDTVLNPFSYFGELKAKTSTSITLPQKSQINFSCSEQDLGYNSITFALKNKEGLPRNVYDKYIFAEDFEAKQIQALSIPIELPWRISEIIILWAYDKQYCFVGAPIDVEETITKLNISNIHFENCPENSIKVCFGNQDCEIKVSISQGTTKKDRKTFYFPEDSLMYASIFSDYEIYNCNFKRLASRLKYQAVIYNEKLRSLTECSNNVDLTILNEKINLVQNINENSVRELQQASQEVKNTNSGASCKLF